MRFCVPANFMPVSLFLLVSTVFFASCACALMPNHEGRNTVLRAYGEGARQNKHAKRPETQRTAVAPLKSGVATAEQAVNTVKKFILAVKKKDWTAVKALYAKWPGKSEIREIQIRRAMILSAHPVLSVRDQSGPTYMVAFGNGTPGAIEVGSPAFKILKITWDDE